MNKDFQEVEYLSSLFMPDTIKALNVIQQITVIVLGWASVTLEVFTRRDFGSRYLSWTRLFLAWFIMGFFDFAREIPSMLGNLVPFGQRTFVDHLHPWFWQGFIVLYIIHRLRIWQRNRQGVQWHSQSFGLSWLEFLSWELLGRLPLIGRYLVIDDWAMYRWIEPGVCFLAGLAMRQFSPATSSWILIASVALFIKNQMVYFTTLNRFLDVIDARIEAANLTRALAGHSKRDTAGFSVVAVPMGDGLFKANPDIAATVKATMR